MISTYATGRYNNGKINWNSVTNSRSVSIVGSFFLFAKHLFNPAFHFYFYRGNDHCHYPNSTIGVIHFYIDDGKLIVYNPDERTSVRGDAGTATIYWTIPGQVFWSISSNISGPMVFSGSVSTTAGDYCPLNGISFDGYVSGLVDVQMMPGSNYATLEGSMLDIQGVSYVLPGVEAYMYH